MAQPDFVVVHPDKSVWGIEVKDWNPSLYRPVRNHGVRLIEVFDGDRWIPRPSPKSQPVSYEKTFRERFFVDFAGVDFRMRVCGSCWFSLPSPKTRPSFCGGWTNLRA